MNIDNEFKLINDNLIKNKKKTIDNINEEINKTSLIIKQEIAKYGVETEIYPKLQKAMTLAIDKFYQKLINLNNYIRKNLIFSIKNQPNDLTFLQENIITIGIESKNVQIKDEIVGHFELLIYNLTIENKLDPFCYKNVQKIIIEQKEKFVPKVNNILTAVLENNKKIIIEKYEELMKKKTEEQPNAYKSNHDFIINYAKKQLDKLTIELNKEAKTKTSKKIDEILKNLKEELLTKRKLKKVQINKNVEQLVDYIDSFVDNLFNKIKETLEVSNEVIYSQDLKKDLTSYNTYVNKLLEKEIIFDKQFTQLRKKLIILTKKDIDSIKCIDLILNQAKEEINETIKINILDCFKTNGFNMNKIITSTNFMKYSIKEKIEELTEEEMIRMFDMLINQ